MNPSKYALILSLAFSTAPAYADPVSLQSLIDAARGQVTTATISPVEQEGVPFLAVGADQKSIGEDRAQAVRNENADLICKALKFEGALGNKTSLVSLANAKIDVWVPTDDEYGPDRATVPTYYWDSMDSYLAFKFGQSTPPRDSRTTEIFSSVTCYRHEDTRQAKPWQPRVDADHAATKNTASGTPDNSGAPVTGGTGQSPAR